MLGWRCVLYVCEYSVWVTLLVLEAEESVKYIYIYSYIQMSRNLE